MFVVERHILKLQFIFRINELWPDQWGFSQNTKLGRMPNEQFDDLIMQELEYFPFITTGLIAWKIQYALSTILSHLNNNNNLLYMKNIHQLNANKL